MSVPEATVNENNLLVAGQHDVRFAGQLSGMQAETEPSPMYKGTNQEFRPRVSGSHAGHDAAAFLSGKYIRHTGPLCPLSAERNSL